MGNPISYAKRAAILGSIAFMVLGCGGTSAVFTFEEDSGASPKRQRALEARITAPFIVIANAEDAGGASSPRIDAGGVGGGAAGGGGAIGGGAPGPAGRGVDADAATKPPGGPTTAGQG